MKIFISSLGSSKISPGLRFLFPFFVFLSGLLFLGGFVLFCIFVKMIFMRSFIFGILFIIFGLPLIGRLLFFLFLLLLPRLFGNFTGKAGREEEPFGPNDDIIDVKCKIETVGKSHQRS